MVVKEGRWLPPTLAFVCDGVPVAAICGDDFQRGRLKEPPRVILGTSFVRHRWNWNGRRVGGKGLPQFQWRTVSQSSSVLSKKHSVLVRMVRVVGSPRPAGDFSQRPSTRKDPTDPGWECPAEVVCHHSVYANLPNEASEAWTI